MRETGTAAGSVAAHGAGADRERDAPQGREPPGPARPGDADRRGGSRVDRGQTTLDFAVGFGVFLVALAFVVAFVPGMLDPFVGGTQAETPAANRVADDLAQRLLGDVDQPYALDTDCTRAFFTAGAPAECSFDGATLQERVGVVDYASVNVTLRGDFTGGDGTDVLCWDDDVEAVVEHDDSACSPSTSADHLLARGSDPSGSGGKTVSARRVASLSGQDVTIEVVMW